MAGFGSLAFVIPSLFHSLSPSLTLSLSLSLSLSHSRSRSLVRVLVSFPSLYQNRRFIFFCHVTIVLRSTK